MHGENGCILIFLNLLQVDIPDRSLLNAQIIQGLALGAVIKAYHQLRQASTLLSVFDIAESLPKSMAAIVTP